MNFVPLLVFAPGAAWLVAVAVVIGAGVRVALLVRQGKQVCPRRQP